MSKSTIQRAEHKERYTVILNSALQDERLSWKARGLLAYMLSLPDDWRIYVSELAKHAKDGEAATRSAFKELVDIGYVTAQTAKDEQGRFLPTRYFVHENPHVENPHVDNPNAENHHVPSTQEQSTQELNTHKDKIESTIQSPGGPAIAEKSAQPELEGMPTLKPTTEQELLLFDMLGKEFSAKGRRRPTKFPNTVVQADFEAVCKHFNGGLEDAIRSTLGRGIFGIPKVVRYLKGWAEREASGAPPVYPNSQPQQPQQERIWHGD